MAHQTIVIHGGSGPAPSPRKDADLSKLSSAQLQALISNSLSSLSMDMFACDQSKAKNTSDDAQIEGALSKELTEDCQKLEEDIQNLVKLSLQEAEAENTVSHESGLTKFFHSVANFFGDHYTTQADVDALKAQVKEALSKCTDDLASALMALDPKLTKSQAKTLAEECLKILSDLVNFCMDALAALGKASSGKPDKNDSSDKSKESNAVKNAGTPPAGNNNDADAAPTDAQIRQMIAEALTLVAQLMGLLAKSSAQNQEDESTIAKQTADQLKTAVQKFITEYKAEIQAEEDAKNSFWGRLSSFLGSTAGQIIMGVLALCLCETIVGVLLVVAVNALIISGGMKKIQDGLASKLGGQDSALAQFFAGAIIIGVTMGAGCAGEGLEIGAEEGGSEASEEAGSEAASSGRSFYPRFATIQATLQELSSTNLVLNFMVGACKADKDKLWVQLLAMGITLLVSVSALGARAYAGSLPGVLVSSVKMQLAMTLFNTALQGLQAGCSISQGQTLIKQSDATKDIGEAQKEENIAAALQKFISSLLDSMTKQYQAVANSQSTILHTDFAAAWEKTAQVSVEIAG